MPDTDDALLGALAAAQHRLIAPEERRHWVRWVLGQSGLTAAHKTVLVALETYADYRDGTNAHPGETLLADMCGLKPRAVRHALELGRQLGLIERTAPANPKAGMAAVYRLIPPPAITGTAVPVETPNTGTTVPVNNFSTGTAVPVETAITGTTVPVNNFSTGTVTTFLPARTCRPPTQAPKQQVLRNPGTSPAARITQATHTTLRPSRFCDEHPRGTRDICPHCANARTAFEAWQADQAAIDVAIAEADAQARRELRDNCPWCHGTNVRDLDDDLAEKCDHQTPPPRRRGPLSLVPPPADTLDDVRAAQ